MITTRSYAQNTGSLESKLFECKQISIILSGKLDSVQIRYEDLYNRYSELNSNYRKCVSDMNIISDEINLSKQDNKKKDGIIQKQNNDISVLDTQNKELIVERNKYKGFTYILSGISVLLTIILIK